MRGACTAPALLLGCVLSTCVAQAGALWGLDWIWRTDQVDSEPPLKVNGMTLVKVPFEAKTDDEKFLEEAKKYTSLKLSDLDTCQHKVVMKIHTSCSELTEEELAKLSVNLLNCQSAVEGRQQFPCTKDMSLRQCTSSMDSDMWNTYHLMSNRARAVCYAARHQQFRALSEMTVNKLMNTAHDQIVAMNVLKEGQQKLESLTVETLDTVAVGQESLLKQQERMRVTQQNLRDFVSLNLRQLSKEKALIAAGHQELAKLTEDVKAKLDAANSQLVSQATEQEENHLEILKDLNIIQKQANIIWSEIERSTQEILAHHESAAAKYEDTLHKLAKINDTVTFLLELMETTKTELDERLGWLSSVVGAAGIYVFLLHGLYLLVGMITTSFLQAPALTKLCLVCLVPLNLAVIYSHGKEASLSFSSITLFVVGSTAVHCFVCYIQAYISKKNTCSVSPTPLMNGFPAKFSPSNPAYLPKSKAKTWWSNVLDAWSNFSAWVKMWPLKMWSVKKLEGYPKVFSSCNSIPDTAYSDEESSDSESSLQFKYMSEGTALHEDVSRQRATGSPALRQRVGSYSFLSPPTPSKSSSRSGTPLRAGTPRPSTPRPLCRATCRSGLLCRNSSLPGSDMCRVHSLNASFD